jgi:benzoylformate decarboxylase
MAALHEHPEIRYILGLQESIVVAMADGYARASNQLAACNVHVAPGLGNAMGAIYNAKFYGSPVLITAGQQEQGHGLTEPLLYDPLVPIATPLVKWAVEVNRIQDLPRIVRRAAKVATTPPTGPVFISLPGDILNDQAELDLGHSTHVDAATRPSDAALEKLADRLLRATNPVIVSGHEVSTTEAFPEATRLAELLAAPVYQQTVPYAAHYPSEHVAFMGSLTRNQRYVRDTLSPYDLLICVGADVLRMSVWSAVDPLPDHMAIVQIAEREWELGKNYPAEIAINANVKETLRALIPVLERKLLADRREANAKRLQALAARNWSAQRAQQRENTLASRAAVPIDPKFLMMRLSECVTPDTIVVEEALVSGLSLLGFLRFRDAHSYYGLASGGIGFATAGTIGIQLAQPQRPVVAIIGDGSAMYSIQALWTAAHLKLPITYVIANNRSYRILKERVLPLQNHHNFIGMDFHDPQIDFVALAKSLGVAAERVTEGDAIEAAMQRARARSGPTLIDVIVHDGFSDK